MGAGKSYWGARISQLTGLPFIDLDQAIEESSRKSIRQIFEEKGEERFRQEESAMLHALIEKQSGFVMACGGGTPCFLQNMDYMKESGTVVWLNPPTEILLTRLRKEQNERPLISGLTDTQLHHFVLHKMAERRIYYEQAHVIIPDNPSDASFLVKQIIHV